MAVTDTLVAIKEYFFAWHENYYEQIHKKVLNQISDQPTDDNKLVTNKGIREYIQNINTALQNNFNSYYTKTAIDSKISTLNTNINKKWDKNPSNGGWTWLDCCGSWDSSNITVWINDQINVGMVHMAMPFDSATAGKKYIWSYMNLPSKYRPNFYYYGAAQIEGGSSAGGGGVLFVTEGGKIGGRFDIGWKYADARTVYGTVWWRWKD